MDLVDLRRALRDAIKHFEPRSDLILIVLSMVSMAVVVANQFISPEMVSLNSVRWADLNLWVRTAIWLVFLADYLVYMLISPNRWRYVRTHVLELLVVLMWVPAGDAAFFRNIARGLVTTDLMQIVGTLAHGWRIVRWTGKRFTDHPIIVTGSAAVLLIASEGALLNHFEPQTFTSFWDGAWFSLTTIATLGYGDYVPHTGIGRMIAVPLILGGISLYGVYLSTVIDWWSRRWLKRNGLSPEDVNALKAKLEEHAALQRQVLEESKAARALHEQVLRELKAQRGQENKEPGSH